MTFSSSTYFVGVLLMLLQVLAAWPWVVLSFLNRNTRDAWRRQPLTRERVPVYGIILAVILVVPAVFHFLVREGATLEVCGQIYAAVLQIQLLIDAFLGVFALLLLIWPKGGAIALAAFREGVRQPMFWLLFGAAFLVHVRSRP